MVEWLYGLDLALFRFGNETIANPLFDIFFPFITEINNFYLLYGLAILALLFLDGKRGAVTVVLLLLLIVVSDQLSSSLIKPLVGRVRPCAALDTLRLLVPCGPGKSFPSSHAVNNVAMAFLVSRFYPGARRYLFTYAALTAFSRVYIGVHYPADILGGTIIGIGVAWCVWTVYRFCDRMLAHTFQSHLLSLTPRNLHG